MGRSLRGIAMLGLGLVVGLVVARLAFAEDDARITAEPRRDGTAVDTLPDTPAGPIPASGAPASSPVSAVEGFLAAEATGDFARSWALLAAEDRARFLTPAGWEAAHEQIPPVTGFQVGPIAEDESVPRCCSSRPDSMASSVSYRLALSPRGGPHQRTAAGAVAFSRSELRPLHLDDGGATGAALAWALDRQACDDRPPSQHGALVGVPGLATQLCGTTGEPSAAALSALPPADATRFVSAFGAAVTDWARVVHLDGPVAMRAVLAPVGEQWLVVGVLPATPSTT